MQVREKTSFKNAALELQSMYACLKIFLVQKSHSKPNHPLPCARLQQRGCRFLPRVWEGEYIQKPTGCSKFLARISVQIPYVPVCRCRQWRRRILCRNADIVPRRGMTSRTLTYRE